MAYGVFVVEAGTLLLGDGVRETGCRALDECRVFRKQSMECVITFFRQVTAETYRRVKDDLQTLLYKLKLPHIPYAEGGLCSSSFDSSMT
jgi:hypothetical protein